MFSYFGKLFGNRARRLTRSQQAQLARLTLTELSPRVLPSTGLRGFAFDSAEHAAYVMISSESSGASRFDGSFESGHSCGAAHASLVASLSNASGATGTAAFDESSGSLKVSVTGAAASTSLDVSIDGTSVGTVTTDDSGNGQSRLTGVTASAGSTILVGDLSGTFAQVHFSAALSGATEGSGNASYNSIRNALRVSISGAAASATNNVTVNDVVVGQLTTNSAGRGRARLTLSGATIASGSTISVIDAVGNPAILTGTFA